MKLISPASQLWPLVEQMGAEPVDFDIRTKPRDPIAIKLEGAGLDVPLEDVEHTGGLLSYVGRQVVLYIPDQGRKIDEAILDGWNDGKKVHVADCEVLKDMRRENRFERYRAVANTSGQFEVFGTSRTGQDVKGTATLRACMVCLKHLNYKGYVTQPSKQPAILRDFNLEEFFLSYSTLFKSLPNSIRQKQGGYPANWSEISKALREKRNWRCENCKLDLSGHSGLLDAHHVNGNKADSDDSNLRSLCKDCHRKQPMHGHMGIDSDDMEALQRLRHKQGILGGDSNWEDIIELADTTFQGLLRLYKNNKIKVPEVGYDILHNRDAVSVQAGVAWPNEKRAVVMFDKEKQLLEAAGWRCQTLSEALRTEALRSYQK
ncbi:MAG: HNH endonuclease [Candidatus Azotimanducaceae bacterium WSBS_2022_MAG_OTU7]